MNPIFLIYFSLKKAVAFYIAPEQDLQSSVSMHSEGDISEVIKVEF